jgi:hypothetical protein
MIYYFQLDPENVEALVALAIMDLRSNEGSPFLPYHALAHLIYLTNLAVLASNLVV